MLGLDSALVIRHSLYSTRMLLIKHFLEMIDVHIGVKLPSCTGYKLEK